MLGSIKARHLPGRITTGAFILHSGLTKRQADAERASALHKMAAQAFPMLESVDPVTFVERLSAAEIAIGGALLAPIVSNGITGAALTGFSAGLLAMYLRTPALHVPGSIWPTQAGTAIAKDVWMLGIGLGLLLESLTDRPR
jgi:uncharacterized membrane protein YkgB